MGVRAAGHRFMPNRLVFPGGRVDLTDRHAPAATELRPETRAALERRAPARLARALAIAAARELEEETGLMLGGPRPALDRLDYLCRAVTPRSFPIRFNARFLTAPAAAATGSLAGSGELERLTWVTPEAVRNLPVAPITACVLAEFEDWVTLPPAARLARPLICLQGAGTRCPEPAGAP